MLNIRLFPMPTSHLSGNRVPIIFARRFLDAEFRLQLTTARVEHEDFQTQLYVRNNTSTKLQYKHAQVTPWLTSMAVLLKTTRRSSRHHLWRPQRHHQNNILHKLTTHECHGQQFLRMMRAVKAHCRRLIQQAVAVTVVLPHLHHHIPFLRMMRMVLMMTQWLHFHHT